MAQYSFNLAYYIVLERKQKRRQAGEGLLTAGTEKSLDTTPLLNLLNSGDPWTSTILL
jgi:hypothetical protein